MSTLRITNIEAKADPSSPTVDEKIKLTNSNGDILVHIDGKTSGITTIGINTTAGNIKFDQNSNVVVTGIITATKFVGTIEPTTLTVGGDLTIPDKIIHTGDTNTAIRFPAADTITAETAGSERLRITSTGAVQITGVDDQDNLLVKASNTHFAIHQDDSDGEVSLRAQDGSGSNNTKYMTFFTEGGSGTTERLRITSGGDMGLGTASPTARLDVRRDDADGKIAEFHQSSGYGIQIRSSQTVATVRAEYNQALIFETGTTATERLRIHSSGVPQFTTTGTQYASASVPAFVVNSNGDHALVLNNQNTTDPRGLFIYQDQDVNNGTSYFLRARAGGTDRVHLYSNGTLQLHSGNLKLASGNGIDFSATGGPGSMTSELLDDYEEGTFTPTETSGANLTLTTAAGLYTKIGRMVHIQVRVKYPSTSNTNHARIGGFPFTPSIYGSNISNGANASGFGYYTGSFIPQLHMDQSQTYTNFYNFSTIVTNANFSARELRFGIVYSAA